MIDSVKVVTSISPIVPALDRWYPVRRNAHGRIVEGYALDCAAYDRALGRLSVFLDLRHREISVEGSLPVLAHGHNVKEITQSEIPTIVDKVDALIAWSLLSPDGDAVARVPSCSRWTVSRVDLMANFRPRRTAMHGALDVLTNLQPSGRAIPFRVGHTMTYYRSRAKRWRTEVAVYDKAAEAKSGRNAPHLADARGVIRIEVRLRGIRTVSAAFGMPRPTLQDVAQLPAIRRAMLARLARLGLRHEHESVIVAFDALAARVGHSRARKLWSFVEAFGRWPLRETCRRLGISRETGYRYARELRAAGLYPATVSTAGVIEELLGQLAEPIEQAALVSASIDRELVAEGA